MIKNKAMPAGRQGFTLVELIVVITIIAVITVAGMVSYGATNKKARDSKRVADIEKIRIALEMARQIGSTYPAEVPVIDGFTSNQTGSILDAAVMVPKYMSAIPKDPKSGSDYYYARDAVSDYKYSIGTSMEDAGSTSTTSNSGYCTGVVNTCNYFVTNP